MTYAKHLAFVATFALSGAAFATAAGAQVLSVSPQGSSITYTLVHKAHTVHGVAKTGIDGKVRVGAPGGAQLMIRVPVASFDSGNGNRDAHMKEAVEAAKFPFVELKAVGEVAAPASFPATQSVTFKGKLTFHGITNPIEVPVSVAWQSAKKAHATGRFSISLEAYKVERPSLLFVKVEDKLDLAFDVQVTE